MNDPTLSAGETPLCHTAFYKFVSLPALDEVVAHLHVVAAGLTGSIVVAPEGINGVIAGSVDAVNSFEQALTNDARFNGCFAGMEFKRSPCKTAPFGRLKIHRKPEIVALNVDAANAHQHPGKQVAPDAWRELIAQPDVVVIDNRNSFEYRLGKFKQAIDPGVEHFSDFPVFVEQHAEQWRAEGKRVAMYCTGGVRCEKIGGWMETLGLDVYQLEGGVLNYFQKMPDADKDWEGECFVFDNRIALDTHLQETDTTLDDVYGGEPDWEWRLQRARRLDRSD